MTTTKNEVFIGLQHENCHFMGKKLGGGSILGGTFPVSGRMSKFLVSGGGNLLPSSPVEKTLISPPNWVKNFKPPIWLRPPGGGENFRSPKA